MCGRLVIAHTQEHIARRLQAFLDMNVVIAPTAHDDAHRGPSYNVAPGAQIPVLACTSDLALIDSYRWGLIPHWAQDDTMANKCFNARSETMAEKPTFRRAFTKSRCIIPIDGYYEWKPGEGQTKQPMFIHAEDKEQLFLAGLCEPSTASATIVTREAQGQLRSIHHRQPIAFNHEEIRQWLHPRTPIDALHSLVQAANTKLETYEVSTLVNNTRNDGEELITPM